MSENAQTEANKRWQKNKEKARYLRNSSTTRSFVKKSSNQRRYRRIWAINNS